MSGDPFLVNLVFRDPQSVVDCHNGGLLHPIGHDLQVVAVVSSSIPFIDQQILLSHPSDENASTHG